MRLHATNVVLIQAPDHAAQVTLELCSANLVWSKDYSSSLFTAAGGHDDPMANDEFIPVGSEIVDAPGIPEANADDTLARRGIVESENRVTFLTTALADLLAEFEAALETLTRASPGFIDRRRRRPGSI
jgi:hypothetical protein